MTSIQDINSAIMFGNFTNDQLNSIHMAIKFRKGQLTKEIKRDLGVGDNVEFVDSRHNRTLSGHVVKIAIKFATVKTSTGLWKVPVNMLTPA